MGANQSPIWIATPNAASGVVTAVNVKSDGSGTIGTDLFLVFTAGANGSFLEMVRWQIIASAANVVGAVTPARLFLSTQSGTSTTTSANTWCIDEILLPSITAASSSGGGFPFDRPFNKLIKAGLSLLCSNHIAPTTNSNWRAIAFYGDY